MIGGLAEALGCWEVHLFLLQYALVTAEHPSKLDNLILIFMEKG